MTNADLTERAAILVEECTVPPHLTGFALLVEAVVIKANRAACKYSDIYQALAHRHDVSPRAAARDITYAISQADGICEALSIKPQEVFNSRVIATLALKLKAWAADAEAEVAAHSYDRTTASRCG
ncbi:MAG: sporulation initiation factor Spo0A C-terminal domain-containing protein [Clostridiales bacterium]|nr:sporulation initiation factor Spo0A C-terminal domain-containing protein [Clostridiales bacterium]